MEITPGFDPLIGAGIAGYKLEALVGRGGMSVVYRAEQQHLGRKVALKLLTPELAQDERFRHRFVTESKLAASLDHPNIIPIYDAGEAGGLLYIAMRFVEGSTLAEFIERHGPLSPSLALSTIDQIAAALDVAHQAGLIHRDVKPENVLVTEKAGVFDHVFLADFGLTKRPNVSGSTRSGELMGTVGYVAPEQIQGRPLDGRADVYSLGCVLFQCLTGCRPFDLDNDVAVLWAHLNRPPPRISDIRSELPRAIDDVVTVALAKEPHARFATAGALAGAATNALVPSDLEHRAETSATAAPTLQRPRAKRAMLVGVGLFLLVIVAVGILLSRPSASNGFVPRRSVNSSLSAAPVVEQQGEQGQRLPTAGIINRSLSSGSYKNPIVVHNAPDPAMVAAGGAFYVYTTQSFYSHLVHMPLLVSHDLIEWRFLGDALPQLPDWADRSPSDTWAPDVHRFQGRYLVYFTERSRLTNRMQIGLAISKSPRGPFRAKETPLVQVAGRNAVDPFVFERGTRRPLLYSSSYGRPLEVQRLSRDGRRLLRTPQPVLAPSTATFYDKLMEGPAVVRRHGFYYLFYSGGHCCGERARYAALVARSRSPFGPFRRAPSNPIVAANRTFKAPGHVFVFRDAARAFWLLYHAMERSDPGTSRYLMLDRIRWRKGWPVVNGGRGPSHRPQPRPELPG